MNLNNENFIFLTNENSLKTNNQMKTLTLNQAIEYASAKFRYKEFSIEQLHKEIKNLIFNKEINLIGFVSTNNEVNLPYDSFKKSVISHMKTLDYCVSYAEKYRTYKKKSSKDTVANSTDSSFKNVLFSKITYLDKAIAYIQNNGGKASIKKVQSALRRHLNNGETCADIINALRLNCKTFRVENPQDPVSKQIVSLAPVVSVFSEPRKPKESTTNYMRSRGYFL